MRKKEIVAMLLAGGQGSRLGILTKAVAKPAVAFGGKYKIIDFTLSNCINSGIDTVGILTQYQPLKLNRHVGIGIPWDLDRNFGGATLLPPYVSSQSGEWYTGTANAVYQNFPFIEYYNPEYVLILSGDHIYKMDYEMMLNDHKQKGADVTIGVYHVPIEEANQFGIMNTDTANRILEFEEKPLSPKSNLASMGIYIFNWETLKNTLEIIESRHEASDFGKHIIPYLLNQNATLYAYEFDGFWKDVGTLEAYWKANMELIDLVPEFNLYEPYWKIYTKNEIQPPQYLGPEAYVEMCILGDGVEIEGHVESSVIGSNVTIGKNAFISHSIIMSGTVIGDGVQIYRGIVGESAHIDNGVVVGQGEADINKDYPNVYDSGISVIGDQSYIPKDVVIGKNCALYGALSKEDFESQVLASGHNIIKEGSI